MSAPERFRSPRLSALTGARAPGAAAGGRRPHLAGFGGDEIEEVLASIRGGPPSGPDRRTGVRCELCSNPLGGGHRGHRHLVDVQDRGLLCVCRACSVHFDRSEALPGKHRLVPERVRRIEDFKFPHALWRGLDIPVDMAFFFENSAEQRIVGFYPGPMGATETRPGLGRWPELVERNPVLATLEADVEALLVNLLRDSDRYWLVPVDVCYELVGIIRQSWRGLAGGPEVWDRLAAFFEELSSRAEPVRSGPRSRPLDRFGSTGIA
jgi:hypothetical protein